MSKCFIEPHQAQTEVWKMLKAHYEAKQLLLRTRLEGNLSEVETARTRGQLVEIKLFLALDKPPPGNNSGDE
jgi:hypothetical protein